jgi:hypothetical protein
LAFLVLFIVEQGYFNLRRREIRSIFDVDRVLAKDTVSWPISFRLEDLTAYNFIYSSEDEKPEGADKSLKRMVGASGFEPPASWSRTRFQALLKSMDSC